MSDRNEIVSRVTAALEGKPAPVAIRNARKVDARGERRGYWVVSDAAGVIMAAGTGEGTFEHCCRTVGLDPADRNAVIDAEGRILTPGYVDIHAHGAWEKSFDDGPDGIDVARAGHAVHGTTRQVLSLITNPVDVICRNIRTVRATMESGRPDILGCHLEGPFLSPAQSGAQSPDALSLPTPGLWDRLLDEWPGGVRIMGAAPELPGAREMGLALLARGVLPSIGHSEADSEAVRAAIPCGYRHVTHLYSAMSTIVRKAGFRHAGIVESAYLYDELSSEIIADGCHLPAPLLQLAYRHIGPQRLVLVTDAMRGAGQTQGESILGSLENGQRVILEDGVAKMPDRTAFAGSICTADRLVRTMVTLAGASLPDAVRMITETPARVLGLSDFYGRVEAGRAADLAVFDHTVRIAMVFKDGAVCFENREEAFQ